SPMALDDLAADIEPQAHAAGSRAIGGLVEALEDVRAVRLGNAGAAIAHRQLNLPAARRPHLYRDLAAVRAVLDGVIDQIDDHLFKAQWIDAGHHRLGRPANDDPRPARVIGCHAHHVLDQTPEVGGLPVEHELARGQPREIEQLAGEAGELIGLLDNGLQSALYP